MRADDDAPPAPPGAPTEPPPSDSRLRTKRWSGVRLLVVDDDGGVRRALVRMLRNFAVTAVATIDDAIRCWEATPFDMVLCDVAMPDGGALALHQIVAARWPELLAKLVFVSGTELTERQLARLGDSSPPFLRKPFDLEEVVACFELLSSTRDAES